MNTLWQDIKYGTRMLWKQPLMTLAAVLCLALGTGATTTVYSVVDGMLFRPLPFAGAERVMTIQDDNQKLGIDGTDVSFANFLDWRAGATAFDGISIYSSRDFALAGDGGEPERLEGQIVSANLFDVIGARPLLGRTFVAGEDEPDAPPVAILSHAVWQRRFAGNREAINRTIKLDGEDHTVVGVMPEGFKFPEWAQVWTPVRARAGMSRGNHNLDCIARLKVGVSVEQANAEMRTISERLAQAYPATNQNWTARVTPFREARIGEFRPVLYVMIGAVMFVLLIACANVANLLLARGAGRRRELAVRAALGASRWRIVRQLLVESVMIALLGGAFGVLLALWGIDLITSAIPIELPYWMAYRLDKRVLVFALLISVLTGIIFGLAPALAASKPNLNETLKEGGRSGEGSLRRSKGRHALVVVELALSLVLLVGATLLMTSFVRLTRVDPGINAQNVLTMRLNLPAARYKDEAAQRDFYQGLSEQIKSVPGIERAAWATIIPFQDSRWGASFAPEGKEYPHGERPGAQFRIITPDYFSTVETRLLRGRNFNAQDNERAPLVAIINETLARRFYPNGDALGKRIQCDEFGERWVEIVGIAADTKTNRMNAPTDPFIYSAFAQTPERQMTLVARTSVEPTTVAAQIRRQVRERDAELAVYEVRTMEEVVARSLWQPRLYGGMFAVFAVAALLLVAVGVYGVIAYAVSQRTHEFGVRMALGAQAGDVLRLVIKQGLILVAFGVGIGLVGALLLTGLLKNLLYGVSAFDPLTFLAVTSLLVLIALVASYIPARRATKVDPMIALRYE